LDLKLRWVRDEFVNKMVPKREREREEKKYN
jgi:hypothetical protein